MLRAIVLCAVCAPAWGQNARVDELVGEGVFGVKWSDTLEAVKARYPDGKRVRAGQVEIWEVRDGRTIFELERRSLDTISFGYLADRLLEIRASFRGTCIEVPTALAKFLGPSDEETASEAINNTAAPRWAPLGTWRGSAFEVDLAFGAKGSCEMSIRPRAFEPVDATRQQLGLE